MSTHKVGAPGSTARRVHDALDAIDASLPPCKDAGDHYDNARRREASIADLLKTETDQWARRVLTDALERARNTGD